MIDSPEKPKSRRVVPGLDDLTNERLVVWAFLETGDPRPDAFLKDLLSDIIVASGIATDEPVPQGLLEERLVYTITAMAESEPQNIDEIVQLRSRHRLAEPAQYS